MGDVGERSSKRRRIDQSHDNKHQYIVESVDQLQSILHFNQSVAPEVKSGVNHFKDFLTTIIKSDEGTTKTKHLQVLRQYCERQSASSKDEHAFPDIISTWSFAVQSNNDPICSAIPAALAQFYRAISGILEFRDSGLELGDALLRHANLRLFDRGLSASKTKDHLTSPCLRLLTEIVSFDGGVLANRVFDHRDVLFKRLDFLLDAPVPDIDSDRRQPSVRRMALRLLIANLKFLDANAKAELLAHGRVLRNCLHGLMNDGDDIVVDVLNAIDSGLVQDTQILRAAKSRLLNAEMLSTLARLYNYEMDPKHPESATVVRDTVHRILLKICTTKKGVLLPQTGWYPLAFDTKQQTLSDEKYINLGLESPLYTEEYNANIPVKNATLASFIQNIKPENDVLLSALLLQIFKSAPELVAEFFSKTSKFTTSTDDDTAWRCHFAFIFSVIQLPIPSRFGWLDGQPTNPPPISIVAESILPRQLDRATLSKYLASGNDLLVLSGARLLTVAIEKLRTILQSFVARGDSSEWQQASTRLIEAVVRRIPKIQDIIHGLQQHEGDYNSVKSTLSECLAMYYQELPETTIGSKFDSTRMLLDVLSRIDVSKTDDEQTTILQNHLLHLLAIAHSSNTTKWWTKSDADSMTLFGQLLRFAVDRSDDQASSQIVTTLRSVVSTVSLLEPNDAAFTALKLSVTSSQKFKVGTETWLIFDNAVHRAVQKPVKYLDVISAVQQTVSDTKPLSLLAAAVAEQWQFAVKRNSGERDVLKNVAEWIVRLFCALESAGEDFRVMQQLQEGMQHQVEGKANDVLQKAIQKGQKKPLSVVNETENIVLPHNQSDERGGVKNLDLGEVLGIPTMNSDKMEDVGRWDERSNFEIAIHSGTMAKLVRCVSSPGEEIRRHAFQTLQQVTHLVETSSYDERTQVSILLGELVQTVRQQGFETSMPSAATELAVRLLHIVADPAHNMYAKANKFLLRSPVWDLKRIVSYWAREILLHEPESDEVSAWIDEIEWLLQWLIDGLKSAEDMDMYRRSGVFEKVLTLYMKPGLSNATKRQILTIIWRGVCVDGADTFVTRIGMQSWLELVRGQDRERNSIISQLCNDLGKKCNAKQISIWRANLPALRASQHIV